MTTRVHFTRCLRSLIFAGLVSACGKSVQVAAQSDIQSTSEASTLQTVAETRAATKLTVPAQAQATTKPTSTTTPTQAQAAARPTAPVAKPVAATRSVSPAKSTATTKSTAHAKPTAPADPRMILAKNEIEEVGSLKPTIYFFPIYNEDIPHCDDDQKEWMYDGNGSRTFKVCHTTNLGCGIEGSCSVIVDGRSHALNIETRISGRDQYFEIPADGCRYGYGVSESCLDPFHTLAADLRRYRPGDVIFVPAVVGLQLPNGVKHDGFFIVRDRGRGINGRGRFDFFSGFLSWRDGENPFKKLGLADVHTNLTYYKVQGARADKIRRDRNYPHLP